MAEEGEDKRMDESLADFQKRVDLYVWLKKGFSANSTRDSYKHGPAYQARKAVIANLRLIGQYQGSRTSRCAFCGLDLRRVLIQSTY